MRRLPKETARERFCRRIASHGGCGNRTVYHIHCRAKTGVVCLNNIPLRREARLWALEASSPLPIDRIFTHSGARAFVACPLKHFGKLGFYKIIELYFALLQYRFVDFNLCARVLEDLPSMNGPFSGICPFNV